MKRRKILHCINSLGIGGAEVLLRDTVQGLPEYEHVVCYLEESAVVLPGFEKYATFNLDHRSWADSFRTIRRLRKILKSHRPDIIHSHLFNATILARIASRKRLSSFVFTVHNILSKDAFEVNRLSLFAEKLTYNKSQVLIAVSQAALDDYKAFIPVKGPAYVVYNFVHEKYFNLNYNYNKPAPEHLRLVAVGNLRRQKNYASLITAVGYLKSAPVSLDIFGGGDEEAMLNELIRNSDANVKLMGRVPDIATVLGNYDAYVMPSLFEGYGIAPMEAMAAGMPVILSDLPVFREIAGDLPTFFQPSDPASIAAAIGATMQSWESAKSNARACKKIILEKASRSVYFQSLKKIYEANWKGVNEPPTN